MMDSITADGPLKEYKGQALGSRGRIVQLVAQVQSLESQLQDVRHKHGIRVLDLINQLNTANTNAEAYKKKSKIEIGRKSKALQTITGDYYRVLNENKRLTSELADASENCKEAKDIQSQRGRALNTSRKGTDMVMEELYTLRMDNIALQHETDRMRQIHKDEKLALRMETETVAEKLELANKRIKTLQKALESQQETARVQKCSFEVALKLLPPGTDRDAFEGLVERVMGHFKKFPDGVKTEDLSSIEPFEAYPTPPYSSSRPAGDVNSRVFKSESKEEGPARKRQRVTEAGSPVARYDSDSEVIMKRERS